MYVRFALLFALAVLSVSANAQNLLLGVNVVQTPQGLRVQSVIPNTPAVGKLQTGDILRFMTASNHPIYSAQRISHVEKAKNAIGADTVAFLEITRNGARRFFQVEFLDQNGTPTATYQTLTPSAAQQMFDDPTSNLDEDEAASNGDESPSVFD